MDGNLKTGPDRRRHGRALRRAACLGLALTLAACGKGDRGFSAVEFTRPETTVSYEVALEGAPSAEIAALAEESLSAWRFQEEDASSLAFLRRRAEGDVETLQRILRSRGYYSAEVEVEVEETGAPEAEDEAEDEAGGEAEDGEPPVDTTALVTFRIEPGPAYTLTTHDFLVAHEGDTDPPPLDAARLGSPVGEQALAAEIAAAEAAGVAFLRRKGFAYAESAGRSGLADPEAATLTVESRIAAGRGYDFGPLGFEGVESVETDYLASYLPWAPGERFDAEKLRTMQRRLFATELFEAVSVRLPEMAPESAALPITVVADERPPRSVAGGLRYDTDLGPSARASFEHRNLFGRNERLLIEAEGGLVEQSLGFGVRKPQFLRHGQELIGDLTFVRTDSDAFTGLSATAFVGIERDIARHWRGGLGAILEASRIERDGERGNGFLLGVPVFATLDSSDDLLNPTSGARARLAATPFAGVFDASATQFLVLDAKGSGYLPLDEARDYVVAARGRVASVMAPEFDLVPANRRLFSGGGGSVRGYRDRFIGPLDDDGDPIGGRSALEAGVELRARLFGDFGGVVFAEAGSVSTEVFPDFAEGVQLAAGIGLRYHTLAGPVRLDLGVPLNPRDADDAFQVYFSIGQAF